MRFVKLKVSTRALKTIEKNGLDAMALEAGVDLWKLPFEDARPQRLQYLAENKGKVPVAHNPRCATGEVVCVLVFVCCACPRVECKRESLHTLAFVRVLLICAVQEPMLAELSVYQCFEQWAILTMRAATLLD